jgi:hypothetical protein
MSREILGDIAKSDPSSYSAQRLKELKAAVDRAAGEFQRARPARSPRSSSALSHLPPRVSTRPLPPVPAA